MRAELAPRRGRGHWNRAATSSSLPCGSAGLTCMAPAPWNPRAQQKPQRWPGPQPACGVRCQPAQGDVLRAGAADHPLPGRGGGRCSAVLCVPIYISSAVRQPSAHFPGPIKGAGLRIARCDAGASPRRCRRCRRRAEAGSIPASLAAPGNSGRRNRLYWPVQKTRLHSPHLSPCPVDAECHMPTVSCHIVLSTPRRYRDSPGTHNPQLLPGIMSHLPAACITSLGWRCCSVYQAGPRHGYNS